MLVPCLVVCLSKTSFNNDHDVVLIKDTFGYDMKGLNIKISMVFSVFTANTVKEGTRITSVFIYTIQVSKANLRF